MVKVLGKEAAPALAYLIKNLNKYSNDNQIAFDCGSAKETPSAIAAIGDAAVAPLLERLPSELWTVQAGIQRSLLLIGRPALVPLVTMARSGRNLDSRRLAITLLAESKENQTIAPALTELLTDYYPEVRHASLEALRKIKYPAAIPALTYALKNEKIPGIRAKAAEALGVYKDRTALDPLVDVYKNTGEEWEAREAALRSLVQGLEPREVVPLVQNVMNERDPLIRKGVLEIISARDDRDFAAILADGLNDPVGMVREAAIDGLVKNKNSGEALKRGLAILDNKVRTAAVFELARRNDPAALNLLPERLWDGNAAIRLEAATILSTRKDSRAFGPLLAIAQQKELGAGNRDQTVSAIRALGVLGDQKALGFLQETLNHQDSYVLRAGLEALGMIPSPESIRALVEYIAKDHEPRLNYAFAARESLIKIGVPSVKPLIDAMGTADRRVFNNLDNEFRSITKGVGAQCIPDLAKGVREGNMEVKRACVTAISQFKDSNAAKVLVDALHDGQLRYEAQRGLNEIGAPAVKHLVPLLDAKDPEVRFLALTTLGLLGEHRALKPLLKALKDEKRKGAAIAALGGIKEPRAARRLIRLLKDENGGIRIQAAASLGAIGDKAAIAPLIAMLESGQVDPDGRDTIIKALGELGAVSASQRIIPFLKDENRQTRITAAEALCRIAAPNSAEALVAALSDPEHVVRDYAYKTLRKMTRVDCGIYPDAWELWLGRNKIFEPPLIKEEEKGFLERIFLFLAEVFQQIMIRQEDLSDYFS